MEACDMEIDVVAAGPSAQGMKEDKVVARVTTVPNTGGKREAKVAIHVKGVAEESSCDDDDDDDYVKKVILGSRDDAYLKFRAIISGFDDSDSYREIKKALKQHFGRCGKIDGIYVPSVDSADDDDDVGRIAYVDFASPDSLVKALQLDGSQLGSRELWVFTFYSHGYGGSN